MQDSFFQHHDGCPNCGSRDNVGVYSDGHKWCFGCRKLFPAPDTVQNIKRKMEPTEKDEPPAFDTTVFSSSISDEALTWLKKYGITDFEIKHYGLCWNTKTSSLVFPIFNVQGQLLYHQERYFGPPKDTPKYLTYGSKTKQLGYITNKDFPDAIVLVEDFVSAIKVARICTCAPLLGSGISANGVKWVCGTFKRARVWLDMDKASKSLSEASKLRMKVPDVQVILTPFDPKDYGTEEIVKILRGFGIKK